MNAILARMQFFREMPPKVEILSPFENLSFQYFQPTSEIISIGKPKLVCLDFDCNLKKVTCNSFNCFVLGVKSSILENQSWFDWILAAFDKSKFEKNSLAIPFTVLFLELKCSLTEDVFLSIFFYWENSYWLITLQRETISPKQIGLFS